MGEAFAWIGQLVEWISSFIPHYIHVHATHRGVMFTRARTRVLEPGIHWYLPFCSDPALYPVRRQTMQLSAQVLTTRDQREVMTSVVVTYEVEDIHRALVDTFDFEDTITESAQGAVKRTIVAKSYEELLEDQRAIDRELARRIRSALRPYGVRVLGAVIKDFGRARVIRLVGEAPNRGA